MKNWNSLLIQIDGELYFADGNFASYDMKFVKGTNVDLVGYSETLKEFFIRFSDEKTFIYKDVPKEIFEGIINPEIASVGSYLNRKVKGYYRYEKIEWGLHKASLTDLCKIYRNMQYTLNINLGNWVTDRIDLVSIENKENLFWKLEFTEQPDNCQRIK